MTQNPNEPQKEDLLDRIAKFILPGDEDDIIPPTDEQTYWVHCQMAFREGLAFGLLRPDLAQRLLDEIVSETAELERPLFGLMQRHEGGQPPSLSDMDALARKDLENAVQQLDEFIRGELGL